MDASTPLYALESDGPTVATFFRGTPHWSHPPDANPALIAEAEARLAVKLPSLLRDLYLIQNGGSSDFAFSAITPDAPLDPPDAVFFELWRHSLPDDALLPVGDLTTMTALQETFDYDPDYAWHEHLPEADRLVRIGQHAWDVYLCLDYGGGRSEPGVVLFNDARWEPGGEAPFEAVWPDFATFFADLRRPALREEDGVLYRGLMRAGPRDLAGASKP
jgi:hypothetical protein